MDIQDAIRQRRSVRRYEQRSIEPEKVSELQALVSKINAEADMHLQFITEEPEAFDTRLVHYGRFSGVRNYLALVGRKAKDLDERAGWYGQQFVLRAEQLGLNTCWVALTYSKKKARVEIAPDERCVCVICVGYGAEKPSRHKPKTFPQVTKVPTGMDVPEWFRRGADAALYAPTAINQQKFCLSLGVDGKSVSAKDGFGVYTKIDLGIVRANFTLGAGGNSFKWADWPEKYTIII